MDAPQIKRALQDVQQKLAEGRLTGLALGYMWEEGGKQVAGVYTAGGFITGIGLAEAIKIDCAHQMQLSEDLD